MNQTVFITNLQFSWRKDELFLLPSISRRHPAVVEVIQKV
jgi:hypothetical protein